MAHVGRPVTSGTISQIIKACDLIRAHIKEVSPGLYEYEEGWSDARISKDSGASKGRVALIRLKDLKMPLLHKGKDVRQRQDPNVVEQRLVSLETIVGELIKDSVAHMAALNKAGLL